MKATIVGQSQPALPVISQAGDGGKEARVWSRNIVQGEPFRTALVSEYRDWRNRFDSVDHETQVETIESCQRILDRAIRLTQKSV